MPPPLFAFVLESIWMQDHRHTSSLICWKNMLVNCSPHSALGSRMPRGWSNKSANSSIQISPLTCVITKQPHLTTKGILTVTLRSSTKGQWNEQYCRARPGIAEGTPGTSHSSFWLERSIHICAFLGFPAHLFRSCAPWQNFKFTILSLLRHWKLLFGKETDIMAKNA